MRPEIMAARFIVPQKDIYYISWIIDAAEGIFAESKIERIEQSMEDVFVYLVKSHAGDDLGDGRISGIGNITANQAQEAKKEGTK